MPKPAFCTFVYVGGPMDGKITQEFWMISATLAVADERVHSYRLRGTPNDPVLSVDGFRILDHCGIVKSPKHGRGGQCGPSQ